MMKPQCILLLLASAANPLAAAVLHVPDEYATIQEAIDEAEAEDIVEVAPGEYVITEPIDFNREHNAGIGSVKNITVRSASGAAETVIRMAELPADPDRAGVFIFEAGETGASVLQGFTISGGQGFFSTRGDVSGTLGGGIYFRNESSPTVLECHIRGNSARGGGGISCTFGAAPTIRDCEISENTAPRGIGGGVGCGLGAAPRISDCVIERNHAGLGAGVYLNASPAQLLRCRIENNATTEAGQGGGVFVVDSEPTIRECDVVRNWASRGGGFLVVGRRGGLVANCLIEGNVASDGQGGGICQYNAVSPTFDSCVVIGNYNFGGEFGSQGGGVYCGSDSFPLFSNCIIAANVARDGGTNKGGVHSFRSRPVLQNCTVVDNVPSAMLCSEASPVVRNSIVLPGAVCGSVFESLEDGDPMFVERGEFDFSSFVTVEIAGQEYELPDFVVVRPDYHLLADSPAIDAGGSDGAPPADFDGESRPCGDAVDIGAYEFVAGGCDSTAIEFLRGDTNDDGPVNLADAVFILEWLFSGRVEPQCVATTNVNGDSGTNIADPTFLLNWLFVVGPPPAAPFPDCGPGALPSDEGACEIAPKSCPQ